MTHSSALLAPVTVPAPGRCRIVPERSVITFATRHLFGLAPVHGTVGLREGRIHVAPRGTESAVQQARLVDRHAFGITTYRGLAARWLRISLDIVAEPEQDR